jgi:glycosyltransferase involved in cell wall biosynthesis
MPAYNAAKTLERTYADIPHDLVDHMILVDDVSRDETVEIAHQLGVEVIVHRQRGRDGREDLVRGGMRRLLLRKSRPATIHRLRRISRKARCRSQTR